MSKFRQLRNEVADINVNSKTYKAKVITEIRSARKIRPETKSRLLRTARAIPAKSFTWKQKWDKGKLWKK